MPLPAAFRSPASFPAGETELPIARSTSSVSAALGAAKSHSQTLVAALVDDAGNPTHSDHMDNDSTTAGARSTSGTLLFKPEVLAQVEARDPEAANWLQTFWGVFTQFGFFALYVVIDAGKGLSWGWTSAVGRPEVSCVTIMNSLLSIVVGAAMTFQFNGGVKAVRQAITDIPQILRYSPIAALFSVAAAFELMSYPPLLDVGTIKICLQLRLPLACAMSFMVLGKRYSANQWLALIIITLGSYVFFVGSEENKVVADNNLAHHISPPGVNCWPDPIANIATFTEEAFYTAAESRRLESEGESAKFLEGLLYLTISSLLVVFASLLSEKTLKEAARTPFYIQKMQMEVTGLWVNLVSAFAMPLFEHWYHGEGEAEARKMWFREEGKGLFHDWGFRACVALLFAMGQAWFGGILCKKFSTVVKTISKSFSLIFTVFTNQLLLSACWAPPLQATMYMHAIVVFCSSVLFAQLPDFAPAPVALIQPPSTFPRATSP